MQEALPTSPSSPAVALRLDDVNKLYRLYRRPLDRLCEALHPLRKSYHVDFPALAHVSLQVNRGETLGIVGRNGSGKSTLLKIIAGVATPTNGQMTVHGRISAMLELGTGFNPELTGLENVYFSGMLMGYSREQMQDRLGAIADFADIGEFLKQPVRSYSSGMLARLGFAVASSVDPDILIIDEALAVGDEAFQRKCFARLRAIQESGATVLFVSHAGTTVVELCTRAVLIDQGQVLLDGAPKFVVNRYHKLIYAPPDCMEQVRAEIRNDARQLRDGLPPQSPAAEPASVSIPNRSGEDQENAYFDPHMRSQSMLEWPVRGARIVDPHLETLQGRRVNVVRRNHDYCFVYRVEFLEPADQVGFGMLLKTLTGYELGGATTLYGEHRIDHVTRGTQADVRIRFTALMTAGSYFLNAGVTALNGGKEIYLHRVIDALMIRVQSSPRDTCTGTVNLLVQPSFSLTRAA